MNAAEWGKALVITVLLAAGLVPAWADSLMFKSDAVYSGEVWRLLTGHFVHQAWIHAVFNGAGLFVLMFWAGITRRSDNALRLLLVGAPLVSIGLIGIGVDWYVGLSAMLHALVVYLLLGSTSYVRLVGIGLLAVKLYWQAQSESQYSIMLDMQVLQEAHWLGVAFGVLYFMVWPQRPSGVSNTLGMGGR